MIDGGLRKIFRTKLRQFHWQAIETGGTGLGIPDSNYCVDGLEGWVEYKKTHGFAIGLRPEQVGWHMKRARAGGLTTIAVRRQTEAGPRKGPAVDQLFMFPGAWADRLDDEGINPDWCLERVARNADFLYDPGPTWNWTSIEMFLKRRRD